MKGIVLAGLRTTALLALFTAAGCACSERLAQAEPTGAGSPKDKPAAATAPESATPVTPPAAGSPAPAEAAEARKPPPAAEPSPKKDTRTARAKPAAEPLDLAALEKGLRETEAIGTLTKLTLKNQVDDLLGRFEAHHEGTNKASLTELRQPFDMLIIKVLSLLQDRDAALAGSIATSREAMWNVLSDPAKFRSFLNQNRG